LRHQAAAIARRTQRESRIDLVEIAEFSGLRIFAPYGRTQALDAATFLIHEDWRILPAYGRTERGDEGLDLFGGFTIAFE